MLETFTLLAWIYIGGSEFELIRRPDLSRRECDLQAIRIDNEHGGRAWCFSDPDGPTWSPSHDRIRYPLCAHPSGTCAWPLLPGRRRI
jgi:hypothetical protein